MSKARPTLKLVNDGLALPSHDHMVQWSLRNLASIVTRHLSPSPQTLAEYTQTARNVLTQRYRHSQDEVMNLLAHGVFHDLAAQRLRAKVTEIEVFLSRLVHLPPSVDPAVTVHGIEMQTPILERADRCESTPQLLGYLDLECQVTCVSGYHLRPRSLEPYQPVAPTDPLLDLPPEHLGAFERFLNLPVNDLRFSADTRAIRVGIDIRNHVVSYSELLRDLKWQTEFTDAPLDMIVVVNSMPAFWQEYFTSERIHVVVIPEHAGATHDLD